MDFYIFWSMTAISDLKILSLCRISRNYRSLGSCGLKIDTRDYYHIKASSINRMTRNASAVASGVMLKAISHWQDLTTSRALFLVLSDILCDSFND